MKKLLATILALVMAVGVTTISWASEVENVAQTTKGNTTTQYSSLAEALNAAKDGGTVELLKNVTLTGNWTTVGAESEPFKGTFDGKGYTITGLNISTSENDYVGFIGMLDGGKVKNVKFASVSVTGKNDVGTAVGRIINGGIVSGVQVLGGTVSGAKRVGGVVGSIIADGSALNCTNAATVTGSVYNVGGIVGAAYYTKTGKQMHITDCKNNGAVTSSGMGAGGIVGLSAANVSGNTNTAEVKGTEVGGIVGEQKSYGSVTNNTNSGAVTYTNGANTYGAGGIIGWLRYHGTSEASAYEVSDIISVTGNKNSGSVTGGNDAGGIVGTVYNSAVIMNNKNTATSFSATTFAAGIVGDYQTTETPAATAPARNKLTFGSNNTSTATLDQINAPCKALLIYTNDNPIIEEVVPDPTPEQPPRYYYNSTTTDTKTDETKGSPKTFDAGIGIYAVTAVLSVTGMAWTAKKRH
ncbi:MAG: hypothetical protein U0O27_03360 [Oscillospiraceae bacterium]